MTSFLIFFAITWVVIFLARLGMNKKIRTFDKPHQEGNVVDMQQYRNRSTLK